jgi:hypothetical protein
MVLIYDLLFSRDGLKSLSDGHYKQMILRNEIRLRGELVKLKIKYKVKNNGDLVDQRVRDSSSECSYVNEFGEIIIINILFYRNH